MIDLTLRCFSRARWITVATSRGILDAQGNPNPGFAVDEIGPVVLTPAVWSGMTLVTPAVMDTWHWVNVRIYGQVYNDDLGSAHPDETGDTSGYKFTRSRLVKWVKDNGTKITLTYRQVSIDVWQFGTTTNRVQLLDPRQYLPIRVREYLGGYIA
jgi:hypothetical protein